MARVPTLVWNSLGLVSLTISMLLAGDALVGLIPYNNRSIAVYRKALSENLAVQYSILASRRDETAIATAMRTLVARNGDVLSALLRTRDGRTVAVAGDHEQHWVLPPGGQPTLTHIQLPIFNGEAPWGTLQVSFREMTPAVAGWLPMSPWARFLAVVAMLAFPGYYLFMRRVLRQGGSSQAVPPRVDAALDALSDGVVMMDQTGAIKMVNGSFAHATDRDARSLRASSLSKLPWMQDDGMPLPSKYKFPWDLTLQRKTPQKGVRLGYATSRQTLRVFFVNSVPIMDDGGRSHGVLTSFDDVTEVDCLRADLRNETEERKRVEAQRDSLGKQLLEATRAKTA